VKNTKVIKKAKKPEMDVKALQLLSRFSLPPNALGYCGRNSAPEKFKRCVIKGDCRGVEAELKKFIVLHPYLKTIAEITGLPRFSYKVAEAYWLGNDLLKKVKPEHYFLLLKNFKKQGVPQWLVDELTARPPKKFIPTHLFQVLHVGVGRASGSVPYNIKTTNNCMIRWGKVKKIEGDKVTVSLNSLKKVRGKYELVVIEERFASIPGFIKMLMIGDVVTVHWGLVTKRLPAHEVSLVSKKTTDLLESL
jgi:hypothetical protein